MENCSKIEKLKVELTNEEKVGIYKQLEAHKQIIYDAKANQINLIAESTITYLKDQKHNMLANFPPKMLNMKMKDLKNADLAEMFKPETEKVNEAIRKSIVEVRESLKQQLAKGDKQKKAHPKRNLSGKKMRYKDKDAGKFADANQNRDLAKSCPRIKQNDFAKSTRKFIKPISSRPVTATKPLADHNGKLLWR